MPLRSHNHPRRVQLRRHEGGFTITELMISTLIFSVILIVVMSGVIYFSQVYYKGITQTKTQTAARNAIDLISQSIQLSGGDYAAGSNFFCVGPRRFSYILNRKVVDASPNGDQALHGLVTDYPSGGCTSGTGTYPGMGTSTLATGAQELLGQNMRLSNLAVSGPDANGAYTISLLIAYGDIDLLAGSGSSTHCKGGFGSQFCASSALVTSVQQRVRSGL